MNKKSIFLFIIFGCILFTTSASFAANHYVRAGALGNGSGADWNQVYRNVL